VKTFVSSKASTDALETLVDLRDGAIHIGANTAVEESLIIAFVQLTESLLADLNRKRAAFWGNQLVVVDTLLEEASDKVAHRVSVKIEAARVRFEHEYRKLPKELKDEVIFMREAHFGGRDQEAMRCPACGSVGLASGDHTVEWRDKEEISADHRTVYDGTVWFTANSFVCAVCGLQLNGIDEIDQVGDPVWELGAEYTDPYNYDNPPRD
jgi:hypothetical protein